MKTKVTRRGQTVVPSLIRERHHIRTGDHLEWIDQGQAIKIVALPENPMQALRGCAKGEKLLDMLLTDRHEERISES